jgi:hypothetical protein
MAPARPDDLGLFAVSMETAVTRVARPGVAGLCWHWRYELALTAGPAGAAVTIELTLGPKWLITGAAVALTILVAALLWPSMRRRLKARAWCVITPHRVRTGCAQAYVQSRDGRLPVVMYSRPAEFGERLLLWCRAGITAADLEAARDIIAAACWAADVRVIPDRQRRHLVLLEVVRREREVISWPHLRQEETDGLEGDVPGIARWGIYSMFDLPR